MAQETVISEVNDIEDKHVHGMSTEKGNSITVRFALKEGYRATLTMLTSDDKKDDNYFKVTFKQLQVPGGAPAAPTQQQAGTGGTTNIEKIEHGKSHDMSTDKGNSINVKFTLNQGYRANLKRDKSDDNVFQVTFETVQGATAGGNQKKHRMEVCVFKRKCDPERVPVSCLSRHTPNTPLYKGDNYDCTEDCRNGNEGLDLPPTWFCFNCACGEDNDRNQQCPICAMKIKGDHKREPDKVYED